MFKLILLFALTLASTAYAEISDTDAQIIAADILKDLHAATQQSSADRKIKDMCRLANKALQIANPSDKGLGEGIAATLLGTFAKGRYWKNDRDGILAFADVTSSVVVNKFYQLLADAGDWDYSVGAARSAGTGKILIPGNAGKLDLELFMYKSNGKVYDVKASGFSLVGQYRGIYQGVLQDMKDARDPASQLVKELTAARGPRRLEILCN